MKRFFVLLFFASAFLWSGKLQAQCSIEEFSFLGNYNGHDYYLSGSYAPWSDANTTATALGGYLATINDAGENAYLWSLTGDWCWIGLTDEAEEGTFVWSNGEPVTYTNWSAGEPNDLDGEDHTHLWGYDNGGWNDLNGGNWLLLYIVEFNNTDADCDGIYDQCDNCDGGDDSGPCDAESFPGFENIPADWACHDNGRKVFVCHGGNTICIDANAVQAHLDHGDFLGPCTGCIEERSTMVDATFDVEIFPNPATDQVFIALSAKAGEATVIIYDKLGRTVYKTTLADGDSTLELSTDRFVTGDHFVQVISDHETITKKLVIVR